MTSLFHVGAHGWRGMLMISTAAVLWGTAGIASRFLYAGSDITPLAVSFYRLAIAAGCTLAFRALAGTLRLHVARPAMPRVFLVGVGLATYQATFFAAVQLAGVSVATLIALGLTPVLVAVGAALIFREQPSWRVVAALACGLTGLALLVGDPAAGTGSNVLLGASLAVGSAAGFAGVTLLSRSLAGRVESADVTLLSFTIAAVLLFPITLLTGFGAPLGLQGLGLLLYMGSLPTALAYALFFRGMHGVQPAVAAGLTLVEPLTAVLLAALLFGERLGFAGMVGGALLSGAVLLLYVARPGEPSVAVA